MGWSGPMPNAQGRMVGYAVEAICDFEGCEEKINRGLGYVCGGMHDGGEYGCGDYFCGRHLYGGLCEECLERSNCPNCDGQGVLEDEETDCPECEGLGYCELEW